MILSISWKNIWRNKLRSMTVIIAVMLGLLAGSFGVAIMNGLAEQRTRAIINNEVSHIQIHNPEFDSNFEAKFKISNTNEIIDFVSKLPETKAVSSRYKIYANIKKIKNRTSAGVFLYGINPNQEKKVTHVHEFIKDSTGNYFEKNKKNQILISEKIAKKLKLENYIITEKTIAEFIEKGISDVIIKGVKPIINKKFRKRINFIRKLKELLGDEAFTENEYYLIRLSTVFKDRIKVNLSFQNKKGEIVEEAFRVIGIYKTTNALFDEMNIFIRNKDLARIAGFKENTSHEIAILLHEKEQANLVSEKIKKQFPNLKVETWGEINPQLVMISDYMVIYNYFLISIILMALAFGIINTMLMAIMERTKEIGMLSAIGMNRKRIFSMIMLETILLTISGAIVGLLINFGTLQYFGKVGIDFSKSVGEGFEGMGYDTVIYPVMHMDFYIGITGLVIFVAILASIYPALKALKLNPAEAVRNDA